MHTNFVVHSAKYMLHLVHTRFVIQSSCEVYFRSEFYLLHTGLLGLVYARLFPFFMHRVFQVSSIVHFL